MGSVSPLGPNLRSDRLPRSALQGIWKLIRPLLKETPSQAGKTLRLAETFALTELSINETLTARSSMPSFQGKWISLLSDGRARPLYTLSRPIGPSIANWLLLELHESDLGGEIRDCLDFANKHINDDNLVRILRIPEYRVNALSLIGRKRHRVIVASALFQKEPFKMHKIYNYATFFSLMKKSIPIRALRIDRAPVIHHSPLSTPTSSISMDSRERTTK